MLRSALLKNIFKSHRYQLILTYFLFSLEMIGTLLRPFFLGMAVNDLLKNSFQGLLYLCFVHFAWIIVGMVRHRFDTRTYSAIYTTIVTRFLSRKFNKENISKLSAHSTLAKEVVDFLEFDLVYVVEAGYNLLGAIIMLYFYDKQVVFICLSFLIPVAIISYFYGKKMRRLNQFKNDELEQQVNIISSGNPLFIRRHYTALRKWQIKISDQEAINFGIMELVVMIVIAASLLVTDKIPGEAVQAGDLIGIYAYILKFVSGLDTIPYSVQRISSLSDIARRLALEEADFEKGYTPAAAV